MDFLAIFPATILAYSGYIAALLVALTVIVFIHEYGHFKVARLCGMKVDVFSIGFGREIWGWNDRHGTRWKIGWLPVGGYVKFAGDLNVTSLPDANTPAQPDEFHGKPIWQRALVVLAGPVANFILAFVLFAAAFFLLGDQVPGPRIGEVIAGSPAEQAGLKPNDLVLKVDGKKVQAFNDIVLVVRDSPGKSLVFDIDRSGEPVALTITPAAEVIDREFYGKFTIGKIGAAASQDPSNFHDVSLMRAMQLSANEISRIVELTIKYVGRLIVGQDTLAQLGGVGTMAKLSGDAASSGIFPYIGMIGLLSVSIGLINLFPIPMLDGGHLVFYAIEAIRRKPLGPQAQEWSFRIGFVVVIFIMLVGNMNDLMRAVLGNLAY
ncbi:RIP metalloprotease RseP [Taklimakanibacter deserti]|uniref:RIP metalloprotease RseP n=1 Tax=Taklimakanibacter deserti TaxID=2267839 RepID=UPI000E65D160